MKLQFTFKHLDHSEALQEYTQKRLNDISLFLLRQGQGQVYFSKTKNKFTVEVTVNSKEKYFKATAENMDVYAAVDGVVGKLEKQFLRMRKVRTNHKKFELSREGKMKNLNNQLEVNMRFKKVA